MTRQINRIHTRFYTFFERNGELIWFDSCDASLLYMERMAGEGARLVNAGKWMNRVEFEQFVADWEAKTGAQEPQEHQNDADRLG